ncbi:cysteine hydrolase [Bacillus sp. WL1]|uniref:isochorismatase family cysteine hydrolase n=1 Tax=Bacillus TaxID=1386 RepID=UPI001B32D40B|nr:isochorismatase family cysteine hydrolase [Bacillus sp. WL1]MBP3972351.1 cysteine hydrolase [Bacillus sp. WL1]
MKYAVLTNDLQYDLVNKNEDRIAAVEAFTPKMVSFLNTMRENDVSIIHLQLINLEDDPKAERYGDFLPVTKGSKGAEILPEFLHETDIIMEKNKDSGFFETNLDETLKKLGVDTIIITGMQTQICVQTTAADGFFRGYNVIVPEDAVVSAKAEDKERALKWLGSYCAKIMSIEEICNSISKNEDISFDGVAIP